MAGAAAAPLHRRLEKVVIRKEEGLVVPLRDGPELIFGDATRIRAKWTAAARVLADPAAAGASYIDLRLPGRPAAGGLPAETVTPVAPAGTTTYSAPGAAAPVTGAPGDSAGRACRPGSGGARTHHAAGAGHRALGSSPAAPTTAWHGLGRRDGTLARSLNLSVEPW